MGPVYILAAALVVAFLAFLVIKLAKMISKEGFETMKNLDDLLALGDSPSMSKVCPNNGVLIGRTTISSTIDEKKALEIIELFNKGTSETEIIKLLGQKISWSCYSSGISNVDSVFNTDPKTSPSALIIFAPKGSTVKFYSNKDAKGSLVFTFNESNSFKTLSSLECPFDAICTDPNSKEFYNLQFSSVNITVPTNNYETRNNLNWFGSSPDSASCPTLSPAAAAAVAAVEAKEKADEVKAAAIADATSKAISKNIVNSIEDSNLGLVDGTAALGSDLDGNMMNVSCPSGDKPKISFMRNTKNAISGSVDINTLSGVKAANRSSSDSCPESSPAPAMGYGTGGGYYFDPEKDC